MAESILRGAQVACYESLSEWLDQPGPAVAVLEGFPGTGKSLLARRLLQLADRSRPAVMVALKPEDSLDELMLSLDEELLAKKVRVLDDALLAGRLSVASLAELLAEKVLVILDEFHWAMEGTRPKKPFFHLFEKLVHRVLPGRLLLLSHHRLERAEWSRSLTLLELKPWSQTEGAAFLRETLQSQGRGDQVPVARDEELALVFGNNPRALCILVESLAEDRLEELVSVLPEAWRMEDRQLDRALLEKLERELVKRILERLDEDRMRLLCLIAVHRNPIKQEALSKLPSTADWRELRRELTRRYLVEAVADHYQAHPLVREVLVLGQDDARRLYPAHSLAADYHARHFQAKQIVKSPGSLGQHYVEACYHLVRCGRAEQVAEISTHFDQYLRTLIKAVSPVPKEPAELDQRIQFLSALLLNGGPLLWEYHLARCLDKRKRPGDDALALIHIRKACGPQAPADAWVLRIRLEGRLEGWEQALAATRQGMLRVQPSQGLYALYLACGEILAGQGQAEAAVELLREGLERIPPSQNLFALYQASAEILAGQNQADLAVALLREGIECIPPSQCLYALYQACSEIQAVEGQREAAVALLLKGIECIPPNQNQYSLYLRCSRLLTYAEKWQEAVHLLETGIAQIPASCGRHHLIYSAFLTLLGAGNRLWIQKLLSMKDLGPTESDFGRLCLLVHDEQWQQLVHEAAKARARRNQLYFFQFEAFGWLCLQNPEQARAVLAQCNDALPGLSLNWLRALIEIKAGDSAAALRLLHEAGLVGSGGQVDLAFLLRLWDERVTFAGSSDPCFIFPLLPPVLTGLATTVRKMNTPSAALRNSPTIRISDLQSPLPFFCFLATEWASGKGGLSTYNRELCIALAKAGCTVTCIAPAVTESEREDAKALGVALVSPAPTPGLSDEARLMQLPTLPNQAKTWICGHDRITGPYSAAAALRGGWAGHILFIHTIPYEIEWFKSECGDITQKADERTELQKDLACQSALVVGVGPSLSNAIDHQLSGYPQRPPVLRLDPGLAELAPATNGSPLLSCLLLGRAEDETLKGLDIAARALGLLKKHEVTLTLRGTQPGQGDRLRDHLKALANNPRIQILPRPYTAEREPIAADLRRATLVLMPSRAEGFGLVGLEALSAGTPVLVSDQSGLGQVLQELGQEAAEWVVPVIDDLEPDAISWEREIDIILRNPSAAREKARRIHAQLAPTLSWQRAAQELLAKLKTLPKV